jgi:hypothetical protein
VNNCKLHEEEYPICQILVYDLHFISKTLLLCNLLLGSHKCQNSMISDNNFDNIFIHAGVCILMKNEGEAVFHFSGVGCGGISIQF